MIRSLEDAWKWYNAVKTLAHDIQRVASRFGIEEWDAVLGNDNRFRERTAADFKDMADVVLADLDDLAILVLFSVFEATARARAGADVDREMTQIHHTAILDAVKDLKESIASGSFAKVTKAFQGMDTDLTAQVNQIRKYRNWVAHGRRDVPENNVEPQAAFERLGHYLGLLAETSTVHTAPPTAPVLPPEG